MKLGDVVDLEVQLALDEGQDDAALRARDRALYLALPSPPARDDALLAAWLDALRARLGTPHVGERVETAQRVLSYALLITGLSMGWGTAEVLLHFEQGGAPVNVGYFLLVLVFGQLATLVLLVLGFVLRSAFSRLPLVGDLGRFLRFLTTRLSRLLGDRTELGERALAQRAAYHRIQTRLGIYQTLERYLLLSQTQLFALGFNLGALASCLRLILLSDLAFSWSTSVASLDAVQVERICAVLAAPFGWLVPDAVPSAVLIEHTQYFRLEGRFSGAAAGTRGDPALAGEWWRFLVACTVTYGLLPRLVTFALFRRGLRRAKDDVPLDTPAVQRVLTRMKTPELSMRAREVPGSGAEPAREVTREAAPAGGLTHLVLYRDLPTAASLLTREVERALGLKVASVHRAGGFDASADAAVCTELSQQTGSVCLLAEAWEAPDKSLRGLVSALRRALGARRTLRVVLVGEASEAGFAAPAPEDVRVFRDRLTLLDDPYLTVDTLLPASADEREAEKQEARA